jgi:hypothetical protein
MYIESNITQQTRPQGFVHKSKFSSERPICSEKREPVIACNFCSAYPHKSYSRGSALYKGKWGFRSAIEIVATQFYLVACAIYSQKCKLGKALENVVLNYQINRSEDLQLQKNVRERGSGGEGMG